MSEKIHGEFKAQCDTKYHKNEGIEWLKECGDDERWWGRPKSVGGWACPEPCHPGANTKANKALKTLRITGRFLAT
jgi:hypothetical protein